jgi:hypothetical protein
VLAVIIAVPLIVLSTRRRTPPADRVTSIAYTVMQSDLRGLLNGQATARRLLGQFVSDPEAAGHLSSPGVNRPVITLVDSGFTAIVTHRNIPEIRCAVAIYARNPLRRFAKSGEIVCE